MKAGLLALLALALAVGFSGLTRDYTEAIRPEPVGDRQLLVLARQKGQLVVVPQEQADGPEVYFPEPEQLELPAGVDLRVLDHRRTRQEQTVWLEVASSESVDYFIYRVTAERVYPLERSSLQRAEVYQALGRAAWRGASVMVVGGLFFWGLGRFSRED